MFSLRKYTKLAGLVEKHSTGYEAEHQHSETEHSK